MAPTYKSRNFPSNPSIIIVDNGLWPREEGHMGIPELLSSRELTFDPSSSNNLNGIIWPILPFGKGGTLFGGPLPVGPLFDEHWAKPPDCDDSGKCLSPLVKNLDSYRLVRPHPLDKSLMAQGVASLNTFPESVHTEMHLAGDGHVHGPEMLPSEITGSKEPSALELIEIGLALALPEYAYGICQHEGLHALLANLFGARVTTLKLLPSETDGHFRFGEVQWVGNLNPTQTTLIFLGPKFGDLLGLSAYAFLDLAGHLPSNKYAQLPLLVLATGLWVDLSMGIISLSNQNDMDRAYSLMGASNERAQFPYRLLHAAIAAGEGIPVLHGFLRLFGSEEPPHVESDSKSGKVRVEGYVELDRVGVRGRF